MQWVLTFIAAAGLGGLLGGFLERRHTSSEGERSRVYASGEARAEREHASKEARAQRLWTLRLETYGTASIYLETQAAVLAWTDPMLGPTPEPPTIEPDEEWIKQSANVAIGSSDAVRSAMRAAAEAHIAFNSARAEWRLFREGSLPAAEAGEIGPRQKMDEARTAAITAVHNAQTVMRDELESM